MLVSFLLLLVLTWSHERSQRPGLRGAADLPLPESALANDNRGAAGVIRGGVLEVALEAKLARWRPDPEVDSLVTVQAFAERGRSARIPGPLLRLSEGLPVRVTIRNSVADSLLIVHGLRAGTVAGPDTLHVLPGSTREVRFRAGRAGTYLYWGAKATQQREVPARVRLGVGETYDFRWRPVRAGSVQLVAQGGPRDPLRLRQVITVR